MPNRLVIFPIGKLAEAQAYVAATDVAWRAYLDDNEPGVDHSGEIFGYINPDIEGQHVTPYYGTPYTWDGVNEIPEPDELIPLRADGVIHTTAIWAET